MNAVLVALCMPAILYACTFSALRPFGEIPLVIAVGSASLACLFAVRVWVSPRLIVFGLLSCVVLLLSIARLMPRSWTTLYDTTAALRQWAWVPILLILLTSFRAFLGVCGAFIERNAMPILLILYVVTRASVLLAAEGEELSRSVRLYTLTNENALVLTIGTVAILSRWRTRLARGVLFLVMLLLTSSAQTLIYALVAAVVAFSRRPRLVVWILLASLLIASLLSLFFMKSLYDLDPNTAIRSLFWRDALIAIWESMGAGVGFGTESVVNNFLAIRSDGWQLRDDFATDRIFIGTHSSFFDVAFRMGIPGIILFMLWFVHAIDPGRGGDLGRRRLAACLACLVIISNAVNSALVSMNFLFGLSFALAWIAYVRQPSRPPGDSRDVGAELTSRQ